MGLSDNVYHSDVMRYKQVNNIYLVVLSLLLWALSVGSLRKMILLWAEAAGAESTSWMTMRMASASTDAWRRGAGSRSSRAGVAVGLGTTAAAVRRAAISGLK